MSINKSNNNNTNNNKGNNNKGNNNKVNNNKTNNKYCKVCHDAGKSETEYNSHFTRESPEPNSKVICPTLLSLECRYCTKKGHTVKYCKILEKDKKQSSYQKKNEEQRLKNDNVKTNNSNNIFDNLDVNDDNEDDDDNDVAEEIRFPSPTISNTNTNTNKTSYASILLSTPVVKKETNVVATPLTKLTTTASTKVATTVSTKVTTTASTEEMRIIQRVEESFAHLDKMYKQNFGKYEGKSWADTDTESESDDDEEDNNNVCDSNW